MDILVTLIVGGVIGWLASLMTKTNKQMGILANIFVGIVGSLLGGFVFGLIGLSAHSTLGRIVVNVAGAVMLIGLLKALRFLR